LRRIFTGSYSLPPLKSPSDPSISDDGREERLEKDLNHTGGFLNESLLDAENGHILDLSPISCKKKFNNAKKQKTATFPKSQKSLQRLL
jgi:hypothetical protein